MWRNRWVAVAIVGVVMAVGTSSARAVGEGETCGGIAGIACDAGLWCDPTPGQCGGADISGKCIRVPEVCTRIFMPVCGCDNKTYGNDCERQAAKVARQSDGECKAAK